MTDEDAVEIQFILTQLEFHFTFEKSLQFALFRTYGIPSISKLLVATSQLSDPATASKRYVDTTVLIREFMQQKPSHPRTLEAIARMNYIHSMYQKNGAIRKEDMLFTLSLFALEPIRWIERYEWRSLEAFEKCALGTFWKSLGDAMGIDYRDLPSTEQGWVDGLHWLDEIATWSEQYEKDNMVPHVDNKATADQTVAILLWGVPKGLKPFGERLVAVIMDDRLRAAMKYEKPPVVYFKLLSLLLGTRKLLLRYLFLPRMFPVEELDKPAADGRRSLCTWDAAPYYVKPTYWRRWGPGALGSRLLGLPLPGDDGDKYYPQGYQLANVGPNGMLGKGTDSARETVSRLQATRTGGCPFTRGKAE
ncbi:MAG: hypothetical protein LQ352_001779 [Teloschistes flavicans]|nr:MAG: hypothetical protein LQ352_001779 [Teloschistes flavicans]